MQIKKDVFKSKILLSEQRNNLHIAIYANYQKEVIISKNSTYCVSNAEEILQNKSSITHNMSIITLILNPFTFL
jgi:hypothetical protein